MSNMSPAADDDLETGIPEIDTEHSLQVQLVKSIRRALAASDRFRAFDLMSRLDEVTHTHFAAEQALMRSNSYPPAALHEREHDRLTEDVARLRRSMAANDQPEAIANAGMIEQTLIDHIKSADRAFGAFLKNRIGG